jgi:malectin (di-glucose binding ER protein)
VAVIQVAPEPCCADLPCQVFEPGSPGLGMAEKRQTSLAVAAGSKKAPAFTYALPSLTLGVSYTVRLHFAENSFSRIGARRFGVTINGAVTFNFWAACLAGVS